MKIIRIIDIVLIIVLLIIGCETILKAKKSEGKQIEEVRKPLLIRIRIITSLTVILSILTMILVLK